MSSRPGHEEKGRRRGIAVEVVRLEEPVVDFDRWVERIVAAAISQDEAESASRAPPLAKER